MRTRLLLGLALLAPAAARGGEGDVRLEVRRDEPLASVVERIHAASGLAIVHAPDELEARRVPGDLAATVPGAHAADLLAFAAALCGLEVRTLDGPAPLALVVPRRTLTTRLRATGLDVDLEFNRGPATWGGPGDRRGSLADATVAALVERVRKGPPDARVTALLLLAHCGPRSAPHARAAAEALDVEPVAEVALWTLERAGHFARPALDALEAWAERTGDARGRRVAEAIRRAPHPDLLAPHRAVRQAPDEFDVVFDTTEGPFRVHVVRAWAPRGADRFYNLVRLGFYDGCAFFRVVEGFVVQFGLHPEPAVTRAWNDATIPDDPVAQSNERGTITFATRGPASRTTQLFVNLKDNGGLDGRGFAPFGRVVEGMDVVDRLHAGYGEAPKQQEIHARGAAYLEEAFPALDTIRTARVVE